MYQGKQRKAQKNSFQKKLKASRKEIEIKLDLWNDSIDDFQQNQNLFLSFQDLKNRKIASYEAIIERTKDEIELLHQDLKSLYSNLSTNLTLVNQILKEESEINTILINRATRIWGMSKKYLETTFNIKNLL